MSIKKFVTFTKSIDEYLASKKVAEKLFLDLCDQRNAAIKEINTSKNRVVDVDSGHVVISDGNVSFFPEISCKNS